MKTVRRGWIFVLGAGVLAAALGTGWARQEARGRPAEAPRPAEASKPAADAPQPSPTVVEPFTLEDVEVRRLPSERVPGVTYKLYVHLPASYHREVREGEEKRQARYPVLYLLDADYSFLIARNITQHLSQRGHLPEVLVVGIAYDGPPQYPHLYRLNRTRDYTPTHVPDGAYGPEYQRHSGGGEGFRRALAEEILPFVEGAYRARSDDRALVGHSFGGLFTAYVLFASPELFQRYILVSPSLWYDDRFIRRHEAAYAAEHRALPARVYAAVGSREINSRHDMVRDLEAFAARLRERRYEGLELRARVLEGETHNSVFPRALSDGIRYVFPDAR